MIRACATSIGKLSLCGRGASGFKSGFSLLEMLIGLVIMSVGILGFVGMMILQIRGNRSARNTNEMATLAQSAIESYSGLCWDLLGNDAVSPWTNGRNNGDVLTTGPLNGLGQTTGTGSPPYFFYRSVVICKEFDVNAAGATPQKCGNNLDAANRPAELACAGLGLNSREKMIRVLVSWLDQDGTCRSKAIDSIAFDWDGPGETCP